MSTRYPASLARSLVASSALAALACSAAGCGAAVTGAVVVGLSDSSSSSSGTGGGATPTQTQVSVPVGPAGGVFALGATTLTVPPGALSTTIQVVISLGSDVARGEYVPVGQAYRFEPAGTVFAIPLSLTLRFDPSRIPAGKTLSDVLVRKRDDGTGTFLDVLPASLDATTNRVRVSLTSFSTFQPAVRIGVDAARSRVQVSPTALNADGSDATVTVTVLNPLGQPIQGLPVVLTTPTSSTQVTQPTVTTDASGIARGSISSLQPGTTTVAAQAGNTVLNEFAQVTFNQLPSPPPPPPPMADHVLISEVVWSAGTATLNPGSFIELYNPTAAAVDLSTYYLTDGNQNATNGGYHDLPGLPANPSTLGLFSATFDYVLQFPPGSSLAPGARTTVAIDGLGYATAYGIDANYCLGGQSGTTAQMLNFQFATRTFTQAPPVGNSVWHWPGEKLVLFQWDGVSDLVSDVDLLQAEGIVELAKADKTGLMVDGPDADLLPSTYQPDTAPALQSQAPLAGAVISQRLDFNETGEIQTNGNGITGNDETSEPFNLTWVAAATATPGQP